MPFFGLLLWQQPMKFELFLGLNAAEAAGLTVTAAFLATAEVIEYPMTAWGFFW
jgi:hypothetical protein